MTGLGSRELARRNAALRTWIGRQILEQRLDAGITQTQLAACAGVDQSHLSRIEAGVANSSLEALVAISACLGAEVGVRFFPTATPRLRDRFQAPMIEALTGAIGREWEARPEVPVPSARGVIDLVLRRSLDHLTVVCECHSELRRLELVLRRLAEKTDALRGQVEAAGVVSSMLLLRSTRATRELVRMFESTLVAAFPARSADALSALTGRAAWPGPAVVWVDVSAGRARILDRPPQGIRVGR